MNSADNSHYPYSYQCSLGSEGSQLKADSIEREETRGLYTDKKGLSSITKEDRERKKRNIGHILKNKTKASLQLSQLQIGQVLNFNLHGSVGIAGSKSVSILKVENGYQLLIGNGRFDDILHLKVIFIDSQDNLVYREKFSNKVTKVRLLRHAHALSVYKKDLSQENNTYLTDEDMFRVNLTARLSLAKKNGKYITIELQNGDIFTLKVIGTPNTPGNVKIIKEGEENNFKDLLKSSTYTLGYSTGGKVGISLSVNGENTCTFNSPICDLFNESEEDIGTRTKNSSQIQNDYTRLLSSIQERDDISITYRSFSPGGEMQINLFKINGGFIVTGPKENPIFSKNQHHIIPLETKNGSLFIGLSQNKVKLNDAKIRKLTKAPSTH